MTRACRLIALVCFVAFTLSCLFPPWLVVYRWDQSKYERIQWAPFWLDSYKIYYLAAAETRQAKYEESQAKWRAATQWAAAESQPTMSRSAGVTGVAEDNEFDRVLRKETERRQRETANAPRPGLPAWSSYESVVLCWSRLTVQLLAILFGSGALLSLGWRHRKEGAPNG